MISSLTPILWQVFAAFWLEGSKEATSLPLASKNLKSLGNYRTGCAIIFLMGRFWSNSIVLRYFTFTFVSVPSFSNKGDEMSFDKLHRTEAIVPSPQALNSSDLRYTPSGICYKSSFEGQSKSILSAVTCWPHVTNFLKLKSVRISPLTMTAKSCLNLSMKPPILT